MYTNRAASKPPAQGGGVDQLSYLPQVTRWKCPQVAKCPGNTDIREKHAEKECLLGPRTAVSIRAAQSGQKYEKQSSMVTLTSKMAEVFMG
ncbi:uncharacterized protein BP5553_05534 [Venustampulla echinocandica]|uniref:Uncharacterized protein n=1 Tax=Venustampulla echinocandica TaxID=2656787 RepID=A0A370TRF5_9HELO|nr:uncharacterized protein BP5553_05534 [Venustampulla echinocandica]RDL38101.1 hypothetical protein BP5553_05534 [Venustampulla echinocandica]